MRYRPEPAGGSATYVITDSTLSLVGAHDVEHSPWGIGLATLSLGVMPLLAWFEFCTGRELGSNSVVADAKQLLLCIYLSGTVLIGLLLNTFNLIQKWVMQRLGRLSQPARLPWSVP